MLNLTRFALLLGPLLLASAGAAAANPVIIGNANDSRCREALSMATAAFRSRSPSLLWPIPQPSHPSTKIILRQSVEDISGGSAIEADPAAFSELRQSPRESSSVTIYWGKDVSAGKRLVVIDQPHGWRGDWYSVYLLRSDHTPELLAKQLENEQTGGGASLEEALPENKWNPPLIMLDTAEKVSWLIDRGEVYDIMADWRVHLVTSNGLTSPCRISFGNSERAGLAGLPLGVRKLAAALDEALGPGNNEGTLHPTASIRLNVREGWANAALRPWAFSVEPYNTRADVLQGLAAWSKGSRQRTALLKRIERGYTAAERDLASYYAAQFNDGPISPRERSRQVLDHMFRSYFVFSNSGD
jgi:hypothetical protein